MLLCAFSSEAPETVGAPIVGQLSAFGCFAQDETSASAGVSAARESEAAARPMTMVLVMGDSPSLEQWRSRYASPTASKRPFRPVFCHARGRREDVSRRDSPQRQLPQKVAKGA
jgi:hypothetical protein